MTKKMAYVDIELGARPHDEYDWGYQIHHLNQDLEHVWSDSPAFGFDGPDEAFAAAAASLDGEYGKGRWTA